MKVNQVLLLSSYYIVACSSCESISSVDKRDDNIRRQMFDIPSAYDYYDSQCCNSGFEEFLNPCPQSEECYSADNCNKCCQGGASSLKLLWHGKCGGEFTLNTDQLDCKLRIEGEVVKSRPMFVDCYCYDDYLITANKAHNSVEFDCLVSDTRQISESETEADICLVSIDEKGNVDFNSNLPSIFSITWKASETISPMSSGEMTITHFDVSCSGGLPIYPGYGKLSHTCPLEGFIDLPGGLDMVDEIDHFGGVPPTDMSWYEFIDGTSANFWPKSGALNVFNPTFAVCACGTCILDYSKLPTSPPTQVTSFPVTNPTSFTWTPTSMPQTSPKVIPVPTTKYPTSSPKLTNIPTTNPTSKPTIRNKIIPKLTTSHSTYPKVTDIPTANPTTGKPTRGGKIARNPTTSRPKLTDIPTTNPTSKPNSSPKSCDFTSCEAYARKNCFVLNKVGERDVCIWNEDDEVSDRKLLEKELAYHRAKIDELRKSKMI